MYAPFKKIFMESMPMRDLFELRIAELQEYMDRRIATIGERRCKSDGLYLLARETQLLNKRLLRNLGR